MTTELKHLWLLDERVLFDNISDGIITLIDQNNLNELQLLQLIIVSEQALLYEEYVMYPYHIVDIDRHKLAIVLDGRVVGFITPRNSKDPDEYWRVGTTFISPNFRGKGLASRSICLFATLGYKLKAWIYEKNIASRKTYERAGFIRGEPKVVDGDAGHMYYNQLPLDI